MEELLLVVEWLPDGEIGGVASMSSRDSGFWFVLFSEDGLY